MSDQNRGNQLNSDHAAFWQSRGQSGLASSAERSSYAASHSASSPGKAASDNRSNQMNPNNPAYHSSRAGKK
nr:unnamed protein product [Callosobruchus analis]